MSRYAAALALGLIGSAPAGCADPAEGDRADEVVVFAAASLQEPFTELEERFEAAHQGVDVRLAFAGSTELAGQIEQGAPADVFVSADRRTMARLGDLAADPHVLATNSLAIAVPPGNPAGLTGLADLASPEVRTVVCAPEVPCGAAAQRLTERVGIELDPVSEEQSVTDVVGKVAGGEAHAGLVYVTDVLRADGDVERLPTPEGVNVENSYPITTVAGAEGTLADEFVAFARGAQGREVLSDAGFGRP